jgi:hypothetical protein
VLFSFFFFFFGLEISVPVNSLSCAVGDEEQETLLQQKKKMNNPLPGFMDVITMEEVEVNQKQSGVKTCKLMVTGAVHLTIWSCTLSGHLVPSVDSGAAQHLSFHKAAGTTREQLFFFF